MATLNMQKMRYINLFNRISRVRSMQCFFYNNAIIFTVPRDQVRRAIGDGGKNIREIQEKLGKKVKVVKVARDSEEIEEFTKKIVEPAEFKSIEVKQDGIVITAGSRERAATLIGRNKRRLEELNEIMSDNFGKELRIV